VGASHSLAPSLNAGRTAVVRDAAQSTASAPHRYARPRSTAGGPGNTPPPSVRGTVVAAFGAIASLGCAAAIGLASIAGSTAPESPGVHHPVPAVRVHPAVARR